MGCFWCTEAIYQQLKGIKKVTSGYAGGTKENPTYEQVCTGETGHAEVSQIEFDLKEISLDDVLYVFWRMHDPTTKNRQGADIGSQYRSIILYTSDEQKKVAEKSKEQAQALYSDPIVTEIKPIDVFYPAENYHQNYYNDNRDYPYCQYVIDPKIEKLKKIKKTISSDPQAP